MITQRLDWFGCSRTEPFNPFQVGSGARWPGELPMVPGRYQLYVGNACPWCHRVSITRALRGLGGQVGCTVP